MLKNAAELSFIFPASQQRRRHVIRSTFSPSQLISSRIANINAAHIKSNTFHWLQHLHALWCRPKSHSLIEQQCLIYFISSNRAHAVKSVLKKYVQTHQKITHPLVFRVGRPVWLFLEVSICSFVRFTVVVLLLSWDSNSVIGDAREVVDASKLRAQA